MAAWWAMILWYFIHAILSCVLLAVNRCSKYARSLNRACVPVKRKPGSIAIVVDSDAARSQKDKIAGVLMWIAALGVRQVALYDMEGVLKTSGAYLKERFMSAYWRRKLKLHSDQLNGYHMNGSKVEEMVVELLCVGDGKAAIAEAAHKACKEFSQLPQEEQQHKVESLCEKDIDRYLQETGPNPELMLVFGDVNCMQGFPPWRIRLTEIMYLGALKDIDHSSLVSAIHSFSGKTQRYGR